MRAHPRRPLVLAVLGIACAAVALGPAGGAAAQQSPPTSAPPQATSGWGVAPSSAGAGGQRDYFVYQLKPGQGFQDTVGVTNLTDQPLTFKIFAKDAFDTAGDGAFALQDDPEQPVGVGSWIQLPVTDYTVQPGTRADIPFNVIVPANATPGDHAGGIIAALLPNLVQPSKDQVLVERRVAARVYVRVAGPLHPGLAITKLSVHATDPVGVGAVVGSTATVTYAVKNIGNVRSVATAELSLNDVFGRHLVTLPPRRLPELLPGSSAVVTVRVPDLHPFVRVRPTLAVHAEGEAAAHTTRSASVWVIPWLPIALLAAVLVGAWIAVRRRREPEGQPPPPPPPAPSPREREPAGV